MCSVSETKDQQRKSLFMWPLVLSGFGPTPAVKITSCWSFFQECHVARHVARLRKVMKVQKDYISFSEQKNPFNILLELYLIINFRTPLVSAPAYY